MEKWVDESDKTGVYASKINVGGLSICVHHYAGYGDQILLSCFGLFEKKDLQTTDFDDARRKALFLVRKKLYGAIFAIDEVEK